jgi:hypothetical protein
LAKKVAILQSNYIPWKGYFDIINSVDEFVLYDEVQYTRRDWRNRNKIKSPQGTMWLTIPVEVKGRYFQKISETRISDPEWRSRHWATISLYYSGAPHFRYYREFFEQLYMGADDAFLSRINHRFLTSICSLLNIETRLTWSSDYHCQGEKTERLIQMCKQTGATYYLSGPSAKGYIDEELFRQEGIVLAYMDYSGYPEYQQLNQPFDHAVSIVDLIFNEGPAAPLFMKSFRPAGHPDSVAASDPWTPLRQMSL